MRAVAGVEASEPTGCCEALPVGGTVTRALEVRVLFTRPCCRNGVCAGATGRGVPAVAGEAEEAAE